jgi:cell wall-associated NlpC family hydrolase
VRPLTTRLAAVAILALLVTPVPRAGADEISEKRAEAQRIASKLDAQGTRLSELAEQYNAARLRSEEVEGQAAAAAAEVTRLDGQVRRMRDLLRDQAVAAYVRGTVPQAVSTDDIDPSRMEQYVDTVVGRRRDALDALRAARLALSEQQAELDAARRASRAAVAEVDASRRAASNAAAAERATLGRVQGELAVLVDAETRRRAEAEARRAQQAAAARAARDRDAAATARPAGSTKQPTKLVEPTGPPPGPPASGASAAVAKAKEQLGDPYEWGASGPDSFDCSGLTLYAWKAGGKSLPHSSAAQYNATTRVPTSALVPGDLLFYGSPIHHVGLFVGNGQMIEASQEGTPVRYASIWRSDLVGAGRVY